MRGEDLHAHVVSDPAVGSPPHARGRRLLVLADGMGGAITPACAGKTSSPTCTTAAQTDHPRMRGED